MNKLELKMKIKIMTLAVIVVLILSACSGTQSDVQASLPSEDVDVDLSTKSAFEQPADTQMENQTREMEQLSSQMKLILGTMSLDQAGLNLSSEQANSLLPLWKVLKNLLASDTSAVAEIEALINQIQDELTEEQQIWVENYTISNEEYRAILTELIPEDLLNSGSLITEEEREERRATAIAENGGAIPQELQGSGNGGGQGMGGGSGVPGVPKSSTGETPADGTRAGQGAGAGAGQINIYLIEELIIELESIATS
jgi:hypothetical protein